MSQSYESLIDNPSAKSKFHRRCYLYLSKNALPSIYYDKVFKKEYLPSRVRYNQFFFYAALGYYIFKLKAGRQLFVDEGERNLGQRKYYTSARSYQNFIAARSDQSSLRSHEQKSPNYNKRSSDITNYNSNHKNEPKQNERERDMSPGLTSFQNYLIAKNSSPLIRYLKKVTFSNSSNNILYQFFREKTLTSQINISNQNRNLQINTTSKQTTESPRIITNSMQPILTTKSDVNRQQFASSFATPLQNLQSLPDDYIRIIQDIEDKRSRSKHRYQPSQLPQTMPNQLAMTQTQMQLPNFRQVSGLQSMGNLPNQTSSLNSLMPQLSNPEINVNYLESLYQNQIMQQKYPEYQDPRLLQINHQSKYSPIAQPQVIQNQVFQTPPQIPILQTQNLLGYPSPNRTYNTNSNQQFTPNPIERAPSSTSHRPNFTPLSNQVIRRNNDDLYKLINKEVLEDFESKKFSQIQNKYKQVTSISKDVQLRIQRDDQSRNPSHRTHFTGRQTAATYVQKHLRGYIIRKRFEMFVKIFYFFKNIQKKTFIKDLTTAHYARKYLVVMKRAFSQKEDLLAGAVKAWRLRKIMKTKEVETLIQQIKDYVQAMDDLIGDFSISERKMELQRGLEQSRFNTVVKLVKLISKMQENGLWLMYKQMERSDRKGSLASSSHQQQRDIFKVQRNRKALGSSYKGSNASSGGATGQQCKKDHYGYLTIENDQTHQRPSLPKNFAIGDQGITSMQSTASFRNKQLNNFYASSNLQGPYYEQNSGRVNDSLQSIEELLNTHTQTVQSTQLQKNLNAYNDIPIKSFSKQFNTTSNCTLNMTNSRFEPNFQSEAYKNQAKEIFQRRMTYNPRQAASRSRERINTNNTMNTLESPLRSSPIKIQSVKQSNIMATIDESLTVQNQPAQNIQRPQTRQSTNTSGAIQPYQSTQNIERKNKFQLTQREIKQQEIKQDDMKPQNNVSEERKFAGSRMNDSRQGNHTLPQKLQRRTREERKQKDSQNDSKNLIDPRQLDPNINMFDSSKANIYASNQSSTHGLFKKRI
ncbi:UNKNOWN [Stylonychia lemnae]|uniref:Iq calmodulin-binding motif family protein n=1 Tax=Stylonychia lemnae TaxID=5949 RepID=A0A078AFC7_STYLE|nr:UNKNOWN [Stylonychia lemnae]|eukprot:CDW80949.1 UNKNOWN [Stylonychia lemnae]